MKILELLGLISIPALASGYIDFCGKTTKWEVLGQEPLLKLKEMNQPVIFAFWHNQILLQSYYYRNILKGLKIASLISLSKDGELISRTMYRQGIGVVRGSSSRRGGHAFIDLAQKIEEGCDIGITPDGPRGPKYEVHPGAVALAARTGAPIIPIAYDVKNKKILKTWDEFRVPFPFSKGRFVLGDPYYVSDDADEESIIKCRSELKSRLNMVHVRAKMQ
ncbi:MAG: lysophospholipid acyltransferase family protein [Candidatus Theseobacter exili]|nr:lysophospholipid acyltransferase family protein [Candidatus Theseobacter exili]